MKEYRRGDAKAGGSCFNLPRSKRTRHFFKQLIYSCTIKIFVTVRKGSRDILLVKTLMRSMSSTIHTKTASRCSMYSTRSARSDRRSGGIYTRSRKQISPRERRQKYEDRWPSTLSNRTEIERPHRNRFRCENR